MPPAHCHAPPSSGKQHQFGSISLETWTDCHAPPWAGAPPGDCNRGVTSPLPIRRALLVQPELLAQAPELAALGLLDVALAISTGALLAEHPTLAEFGNPVLEPVTLRRARQVLARIEPLERALRHYRVAVIALARAAETDDDDLPF